MGICYGANFRYGKEACKGADLCVDNASNVEGFDKAFSLTSDTGGSYGGPSSAQGDYSFDDTLYIHVGGSFGLDQAPQGVDYGLIQSDSNLKKRLGTAACYYDEYGQVSKLDENHSQDVVSESNDNNFDIDKRAANCPQSYKFTYRHAPAEWFGFLEKAAMGNTAFNNIAQALDKIITGIAWVLSKKNICYNQSLYDVVLDSPMEIVGLG